MATALEELRHSRGLSRRELARKSGVGARTIYGVEREGRTPRRASVEALARALGCDPDALSGGAQERNDYLIAVHDLADVVGLVRAVVNAAGVPAEARDTFITEGVAAVLEMANAWRPSSGSFAVFARAYLPVRIQEITGR